MKRYFLVLILVFLSIASYSQKQEWLFMSKIERDSSIWQWNKGEELIGELINFYYPRYSSWKPSKKWALKGLKQGNYIKASFNTDKQPLGVLRDSAIKWLTNGLPSIQAEYYAQNISFVSAEIMLKPFNIHVNLKNIKVNRDFLFQPTAIFPIKKETVKKVLNNKINLSSNDTLYISEIKLKAKILKENIKSKCIIGNISYVDHFITKKKFINTNNNNFKINWNRNLSKIKKNPGVFLTLPKVIEKYGTLPKVELLLPDSLNNKEKIEYVGEYLHKVLETYNDYENFLDKSRILKIHKHIIENSNSLDHYYFRVDTLFNSINDTHFNLINSKDPFYYYSKRQPIHFYRIKDEIHVVAVFDSTLNKVNLGDKLIKINNNDVEAFIRNNSNTVAASTSHNRERKIIQRLLLNALEKAKDSVKLTLYNKNKNEKYTQILDSSRIYNHKINIPKNFNIKPNKLFYENYGNIAYMRIPDFYDEKIIPFFYSYIDSLKTSSGLVLDLRDNVAGDHSFGFLLSFFIKQLTPSRPFSIRSPDDVFKTTLYETWVFKPSKFYYYNKPIVILVNSKTTCAAEFFIQEIKKVRKDVVIIGTTKTAGSAEMERITYLPETQNFDGAIKYTYESKNFPNQIDIQGIMPSINTYFESYKDLAPYNDKLLKIGLEYLKIFPQYNMKNNNYED